MNTTNYLNMKIHDLNAKDQLLWVEVEKLLKDNELCFECTKRIFAVTTKRFDFESVKNDNKIFKSPEITSIINSPEDSLYKYMYEPEYCDNYYGNQIYSIQLPISYDDCQFNYIIILLKNDNVIIGRYGDIEFGHQLSKCYYYDDTKQVHFDKLDEPYKSLIVEKLFEENGV